jgi:hypothetical protein
MNILANRPEPRPFEDDTFDFGDGQFGDDNTLELGAVGDDIEGEYTANLKRLGSPLLLDLEKEESEKPKIRKPVQRYYLLSPRTPTLSFTWGSELMVGRAKTRRRRYRGT